jgi:hypothetical protein
MMTSITLMCFSRPKLLTDGTETKMTMKLHHLVSFAIYSLSFVIMPSMAQRKISCLIFYLDSGCVAQQFWLLSRHGSRNPSTGEMMTLKSILPLIQNEIISNYKAGKGSLCKDDVENLEKWVFRANVSDDEYLVKEGFKELEDIGDRYQDRFPKLITKPFTNSSYIVCSILLL